MLLLFPRRALLFSAQKQPFQEATAATAITMILVTW